MEVTEHFLACVAQDDCGAFVEVTPELALERAATLDAGPVSGPLHGMPLADKDLYRRAGTVTTFGSRAFLGQVAEASDPITPILDGTGAVSLGKTATAEFGFCGYTSTLAHGPTTIPGHPMLGAGGSSGGAAAAVAAGLLPFAPGSDAGGSVRIPAAACGVVGIKPTRGRTPLGSGHLAELVTHGALARNVADAALLMGAMADLPLLDAAQPGERRRVGIVRDFAPWAGITDGDPSPEAVAAVEAAGEALRAAGHEVVDFEGPDLPGYAEAFRVLWHASAAQLEPSPETLALFEPLTRYFVENGRTFTEEQIAAAHRTLSEHEEAVVQAFARFDAVVSPTTALPPRRIDWHGDDPEVNFRRQCEYTPHASVVNVAGLPAVSLPVVRFDGGLTMSVQLIGRAQEEATIVGLATELERSVGL